MVGKGCHNPGEDPRKPMGTEVVDNPGADKAAEGMEPASILGAEAAMHLGARRRPGEFQEREKDPVWEARGGN